MDNGGYPCQEVRKSTEIRKEDCMVTRPWKGPVERQRDHDFSGRHSRTAVTAKSGMWEDYEGTHLRKELL